MSEQYEVDQCKRCAKELNGHYCSACGHPREMPKINGRYILSEIGSVFNFEKGILFTIRELLTRPGENIQQFILEDRSRLVKPIIFLIVCSLVYTITQQMTRFEDGYVNFAFEEHTATTRIFEWISNNYGYANIMMAVFIALWIKVFFRKYGYNYFEIMILLCFTMGVGMLIFSVFGMIDSLVDWKIIDKGFLLGVLYIAWAMAQFFEKRKWLNYLKAFLAYMLGMFTFFFIVIMLGGLIDMLNK